jgi:type III restriction enzyme
VIELHEFQKVASDSIADRFSEYIADPVVTGTAAHQRFLPFYQALASITASGKTVILADAVQTIAASLPIAPLVLWLSKGKVVVEQTYANLLPGGKYHHLLGDCDVRTLAEYDAQEVRDSTKPLVYFATVGTFNQKDKEEGKLLVYKSDIDIAEKSTWDALHERLGTDNIRRPLVIVYDEAHNISNQQTDLLLELEPEGLLLASATMRLPERLGAVVELLKANGWIDDRLVTAVDANAVVDAGLVKSTVLLAGYQAPMEEAVSALLDDLQDAQTDAKAYGLEGRPKAIYVCKTNIVEGDASRADDPKRPFAQREAPPILLWRYLVETGGIPPEKIAVYCSLKFDKNYPPPDTFRLFKGGDKDFTEFSEGDFEHVIFNLGLQEGWDDPLCYFAYIDKSMESHVQVEQVIGRALRQPGAHHYPADRLNTAHFYVRVDRNETFSGVLDSISEKLQAEAPGVRIIKTPPGKQAPVAVEPNGEYDVPSVAIKSDEAVEPVQKIVDELTDYRGGDGINTRSAGARTIVKRLVGVTDNAEAKWETFEQSNVVRARWLFDREVRRRHQGALGVAATSDPKFDAVVGLGSRAHEHIITTAERVVDAYLANVYLKQRKYDPYPIGPLMMRRDDMVEFTNAIHGGYDGLNTLEETFAKALDKAGVPWARNVPRTGFGIPLISLGPTNVFYPDFIAWSNRNVFVIDTKGGHLLSEAAVRKLLRIAYPDGLKRKLRVRFVSEGRWNEFAKLEQKDGYTVWGVRHDGTRQTTHLDELDGVVKAVLKAVDP